MFITPALAQAADGAGAAGGFGQFLPLILIVIVFYFLLIRPQQKRMKQHKELIGQIRRGDVVVTAGGLVGKVAKVDDDELSVDLAENVRVKVVRSTIADVRSKTEPANDKK